MLKENYKSFIEKTSKSLISHYETTTNKKYDPNDLNSIIDVIHFLNGDLVYANNLYSKYDTDEMLIIKDENSFLIIIDKEYRENQLGDTEQDIKKMCLRMLWMYINYYIDKKGNNNLNNIIYPQSNSINIEEVLELINKEKTHQKKLNYKK